MMPEPVETGSNDTNLYVRIPKAWKDTIDRNARRTGLRKADMTRQVIRAGMVHLGLTEPEEDEDPGVPSETIAKVIDLSRRQS